MTGAYLYRLLAEKGHRVDIFDERPTTRCGLTPCAWGTSRGFDKLVAGAGLIPSDYLLVPSEEILIDGISIRADLRTFDKRKLINDLLGNADVFDHSSLDPSLYDRVIDATGVSRAFLPPVRDDVTLPCIQYRVLTSISLENRIKLGRIGYAWSFPLSGNEYHIGCGSLIADPHEVLRDIGWFDTKGDGAQEVVCACKGRIRLTGPRRSLPFVTRDGENEVWGVGEAIGCVAPLAGDGVIPSMRSAQLLLHWWDDPSGYTEAVFHEFGWMDEERRVIDKLTVNKRLGAKDAWVLKRNSVRMGMEVSFKDALLLLQHLR